MTGPPPLPQPTHHELAGMLARLAGDQAALAHRVTAVEDKVEDLAGAFDDIEAVLDQHTAPPTPTPPAQTDPIGPDGAAVPKDGLDMRRLVAWVRDNIALLIERKIPQTSGWPHWCRQWWMHPEAIARFEALRRSWADAVISDGNAMVVYYEHLDAMLGVLCGDNGPFCGCTKGQHRDDTSACPLGQDDPDESYFTELEHALTPTGRPVNPPTAPTHRPGGMMPESEAV